MKRKQQTTQRGPGGDQEIDFNDWSINKLYIQSGPRKDYRFRNVKVPYLKGLRLRYSPLTQKKIFTLMYGYRGRSLKLPLNIFIYGHYGTLEVSEELLKLYKKYYDRTKGYWRHDPKEQLITQRELNLSQELSTREVIQRIMQDEFPRKSKIGKLAMSSQKTYARFLMGYHERFNQLIFDETEKGWGTITPKGGLDWKSFWAKYPPKNKDPKNSEKEISVYDSNNLGPVVIDHLTKGIISKYLECRPRTPGMKENILDALQSLYTYAENRLKCFGDKPPAVNPTHDIEILKDDETHTKASLWNEVAFDDDQIPQVDRAIIKIVRERPFESEAFMLLGCTKFRIEELLKLKKSDLKDKYILFRKETKKERAQGTVKDEKIPYTEEIVRALDRLHRQYRRKQHQKFRFIPWLIPSSRIDWGNPDSKYRQSNRTRKKNLHGAWRALKKHLKIGGTIKTLRKTYFTQKVAVEMSRGLTEEEAIENISKTSHRSPKMVKTKYNKPSEKVKMKRAQKLSEVLAFKRKKS